jgi:hypothetical protein
MLQGEPTAVGMTEFNSSIDRTLWNVAPTLDVTGKHGLEFRLGGSYLFSRPPAQWHGQRERVAEGPSAEATGRSSPCAANSSAI